MPIVDPDPGLARGSRFVDFGTPLRNLSQAQESAQLLGGADLVTELFKSAVDGLQRRK